MKFEQPLSCVRVGCTEGEYHRHVEGQDDNPYATMKPMMILRQIDGQLHLWWVYSRGMDATQEDVDRGLALYTGAMQKYGEWIPVEERT